MICLAPSPEGVLGAWLLAGPSATAPTPANIAAISANAAAGAPSVNAGAPGFWSMAAADGGPVDVKRVLKPKRGDVYGMATGVLRIARAGRYFVTLGVDDGVEMYVDGVSVFRRDDARPERDDDDAIALDLTPGDHRIALVLHQRDGAWTFRVRLLDASWSAASDACLALAGTTDDDAQLLAGKMSKVTFDRGLRGSADGYAPELTVRYPEGVPIANSASTVDLGVSAKLVDATGAELFAVDPGSIDAHAAEMTVHLPAITGPMLAAIEDRTSTFVVTIAGRTLRLPFHLLAATRAAVTKARRALAASKDPDPSVEHLADLLEGRVGRGDADLISQAKEAAELGRAAAAIEAGADPFEGRTGVQRRAYRSPLDGHLHEYGLYIPPGWKGGGIKPFPLVVALHGMNGLPLAMMRWIFGGDDPKRDQFWEERHLDADPATGFAGIGGFDGFVVTPDGFGNSMYREMGEEDALAVLHEVTARYRIDPARTTITGLSMGGIGAAAVPLHHPEIFAAAEPLCGYHSYFVRRDISGHPLRPWERLLAEERSNVQWAENGQNLPLYIVHGTMDTPVANSGVLIDRYKELADEKHGGWQEIDEHPALGHNVWSKTYEDLKGLDWLAGKSRVLHPKTIRFRTVRLRDGDDDWVHVVRFSAPDKWAELTAHASPKRIDVTEANVAALRFDRQPSLGTDAEIVVHVDGQMVKFAASDTSLELHREGQNWMAGPAPATSASTPWKQGHVTGPIRDAFNEPLLFVYGASDPTEAKVNERVARAFARVRGGMNVEYPVMSDVEFFARGEHLDNERTLFLVGRAATNRVTRELEASFPIKVDGAKIVVGDEKIAGDQVGAAFVRPNPRRPDRYVVVIEGADARGTLRALSLPDLVPDFVVYDAAVAPARGQLILNAASARAAGFFGNDWSLPADHADPLSTTPRAAAKTAHDATPYLP